MSTTATVTMILASSVLGGGLVVSIVVSVRASRPVSRRERDPHPR